MKDKRMARGGAVRLAAVVLSSAAVGALLVGMTPAQAVDSESVYPITTAQWPGYADLIEQVMPTVVTITTTRGNENRMAAAPRAPREFPRGFEGPGSDEMERFMRRFFGDRMPPHGGPQMPAAAAGSGFVIAAEGLIVTNNHVVAGASEVSVKLHDGREFDAEIIGTDRDTDLALLDIEANDLPTATFADSDRVRVGDPVVAVGNPFGLGGTVTAGIVSGSNRTIGAGRYDDFLQIDAPINRGNSGGPTFNLAGKVIGVNTAIHSPTGGNVGIGFAIPANLARDVIDDLSDDGMVERGWLGVQIQGVDDDLAQSLDLDEPAGALVAQVFADSPAAGAGVERGDVILRYDGEEIETLRDLTRAVADTEPGSEAEVVVWRDGEEVTLGVGIRQMPGDEQTVAALDDQAEDGDDAPKLGVMLAELTAEARDAFQVPGDVAGVVVTDVQPGSPAARKGLQRGDVIIEADRQPATDPGTVAESVRSAAERGDEAILLLIQRDGRQRFVAVVLERA